MARTKKIVLVILSLVVALFVVELVREKVVYLYNARYLQHTYWLVKQGMTKEEVKQLVGEPEGIISNEPGESWYWSASNHQGALWELLGLTTAKGHYDLIITFDDQNRVSDVYGAVN